MTYFKNERFSWHEKKNRKTEQRDRQFLVEEIIHSIEFINPYENAIEKNPEITDTVKNNYIKAHVPASLC